MGLEHFYGFVDRALLDPLLALSWESGLRMHPRRRAEAERLVAFAVEPDDSEPDTEAVADILARRTLRWTMKRATPAYFFMVEVIELVPLVRRRSPQVWSPFYETALKVLSALVSPVWGL